MEITKPVNKIQHVITDIICDSCGKSCKVDEIIIENAAREDNGQPHYYFEYMKLEANYGYGSKYDLQKWTAHICEKCIEEKLMPIIKFSKVLLSLVPGGDTIILKD